MRAGGLTSLNVPFMGHLCPFNSPNSSPASMTMRIEPPGRASNSQTGFVTPLGPHHLAISPGSVHALKTSSRGALKIRFIVNSLAFGFVFDMQSPLSLYFRIRYQTPSTVEKAAIVFLRRTNNIQHLYSRYCRENFYRFWGRSSLFIHGGAEE